MCVVDGALFLVEVIDVIDYLLELFVSLSMTEVTESSMTDAVRVFITTAILHLTYFIQLKFSFPPLLSKRIQRYLMRLQISSLVDQKTKP